MTSTAVNAAFLNLGIDTINTIALQKDPETQEEFQKILYDANVYPQITWSQYKQAYDSVLEKYKLIQLRNYRNMLIRNTDWVMTADVFSSLSNQSDWIAYRQALRNLPSTQTLFVWKNGELDFKQMNIPQAPPVLRT